ncbi:MAG: hypothetical protein H7146_02125 [Burkholderiaceae bacterium]|nr:hypothetical protein [Microbacteriaceae bacterium]
MSVTSVRTLVGAIAAFVLIVGGAVVVLGGGLAAPASAAPSVLSETQRAQIRSTIFDTRWDYTTQNLRDTPRPPVEDSRTVLDQDWSRVVAGCLGEKGFAVEQTGGGFTYLGSSGLAPASYAVVNYECSISNVPLSSVLDLLGPQHLDALYAYWTGIVTPCLELAGQTVSDPPGINAFRVRASAQWDPFVAVRETYAAADVPLFESRCPPIPTWLNLGGDEGDGG